MNELKTCPFCGADGEIKTSYNGYHERDMYTVVCSNPKCEINYLAMKMKPTEDEAIAAWNTRAPVEYDGWFYLPKPKESIVQYGEQRTEKTEHGYKVTQPVGVIESAIRSWGDELGEYIMKRICEAWSTRSAPGSGMCVITPIVPNSDMGRCSACGQIADVASNYCWRCGAKAVKR